MRFKAYIEIYYLLIKGTIYTTYPYFCINPESFPPIKKVICNIICELKSNKHHCVTFKTRRRRFKPNFTRSNTSNIQTHKYSKYLFKRWLLIFGWQEHFQVIEPRLSSIHYTRKETSLTLTTMEVSPSCQWPTILSKPSQTKVKAQLHSRHSRVPSWVQEIKQDIHGIDPELQNHPTKVFEFTNPYYSVETLTPPRHSMNWD